MGEDVLIGQLGLLLTQTRSARRALEDIERATSNYGTFNFTSVVTAGPKFGAPPMYDGALKVHVVNISDLAPGGGFGAFLQGLLGGAGAFVGNLVGGFGGSLISSLAIPNYLDTINEIATRVERILKLLGVGEPAKPDPAAAAVKAGKTAATEPAPQTAAAVEPAGNQVARMDNLRGMLDGITGVFRAASGKPPQKTEVANAPLGTDAQNWLALGARAQGIVESLSRLVDGLVLTLPLLLGAFAWLITRLVDIRQAIAETLAFVLRNTLLLRGSLAVIAFDTLAMVARMAANVVGILAKALDGILTAVFDTVREALFATMDLAAALGTSVASTVDRLLNWLVPAVDTILRNFADLRAFRVLTHVVRILPAIIPPLYALANDNKALPKNQADALTKAAELPFLDALTPGKPGATGAPVLPPPVPDFGAALTDQKSRDAVTAQFDRLKQVTRDGVRTVAGAMQTTMTDLAVRADTGARAEARLSDSVLDRGLEQVRKRSVELAGALVVGETVEPDSRLKKIADAYGAWMTGGGMDALLNRITDHFTGERGRKGVPDAITSAGAAARPAATIRIDEVVIEVGGAQAAPGSAAPAQPAAPGPLGVSDLPFPPSADRDYMEHDARMRADYALRGGRGLGPLPL
ncbi:hypothetical protein PV396_11050 [Streptomyces sp. ME02-8801-2C]|uniref:hypothetical protein n=1 Tax=Streptomyces sp. ME02-8801-2C TaxID=3028680 RepID=UPI0029BAF9D7|nr:hypothetical protein [Streptomyces sp. ME02-8801-2C]MDX3452476.1 hypothetical protein [Streptomyces sp. ME02-8801-2C]